MSRIYEEHPKKGGYIRCTDCGTDSVGNPNGRELFECNHGKYFWGYNFTNNGETLVKYTLPRVTRFITGKIITDD